MGDASGRLGLHDVVRHGGSLMRGRAGALLVAALAVAGCGTVAEDTIRVGWFGSLTGDSAVWGQAEQNAIRMLFDETNAKGGVDVGGKRYRLELVGYDDKGDGNEAVNVVQ